jgi:hypothetical protein
MLGLVEVLEPNERVGQAVNAGEHAEWLIRLLGFSDSTVGSDPRGVGLVLPDERGRECLTSLFRESSSAC